MTDNTRRRLTIASIVLDLITTSALIVLLIRLFTV